VPLDFDDNDMTFPSTILLILTLIGLAFRDAAAASDTTPRFAYVANGQDDTVSIFAIEKAHLRAAGYVYVGSGSNPVSVAVTPSQRFLYVASGASGVYGYTIDSATGTVGPIPGSPFGTGPEFSISVTPSEHFLIAAGAGGISSYSIVPDNGALILSGTVPGQKVISIAIDPKAPFAYAASENTDKISGFAIDQNTGALTPVPDSPFSVGEGPQAIAMDPFGKFLYVANGNSDDISAFAINAKTGMLAEVQGSPFAAGSDPVSAVLTRSGEVLYVGNAADKTVSQYEVNRITGALVSLAQPFSTGPAGPLGLTDNPAEPLLYVADHDSNDVRVLGITREGVLFNESSIRSRGPATAIALASGNSAISYAPKFLYESNATSNDIWGYEVSPGGRTPANIVSDRIGQFIFSANSGDQNISAFIVNSQTGSLTPAPGSPFRAGTPPYAIAVDPNAHYIYVTNPKRNTISGFAVSSKGSLTRVPGSPFVDAGSTPEGITIDPRGKVLYVTNAESNTISLYQINARTGALMTSGSVAAGGSPIAATIDSEGKYLYALDQSPIKISCYAIDGVTGDLSPLPDAPSSDATTLNSISVDPLGKRVYAAGGTLVAGYVLFGTTGHLKLLPSSPFGPVSAASSLTIDLSNSFLWVSNRDTNGISGFAIDKITGSLTPLAGSPFDAGTNPGSITVVNSFQAKLVD
jgi:6-phosphogluconolactonase